MKRKIIMSGFLLLFAIQAAAAVMVMPFNVDSSGEKSHQWLGRSFSFYLTAGLELNGIRVMTDPRTVALLESHYFSFPYNITKASVVRLAREYNSDTVVWGDIQWDSRDNSQVQVQPFIIRLKDYSRENLPIMKGQIDDLPRMRDELLVSAVKALRPMDTGAGAPAGDILIPSLNLMHRSYEIFIKSLLIKDTSKKIELLTEAMKLTDNSDFLNFEMAEAYYEKGDIPNAAALLDKVPDNSPTSIVENNKLFLKALIDQAGGDTGSAIESYFTLEKKNAYPEEVQHNLGVIYADRKDYKRSSAYFQNVLKERPDPETWYYYVIVLLSMEDADQSARRLKQASILFPEDENLVDLFSYFLSLEENRELLFTLFENYISDVYLTEKGYFPAVTYKPLNPFKENLLTLPAEIKKLKEEEFENDAENGNGNGTNGNNDSVIERVDELISDNPYISKYYNFMSRLYLKKKDYKQAELYALGAVFLEDSKDNYLNLAGIYDVSGNKEKAEAIRNKFSQNGDK